MSGNLKFYGGIIIITYKTLEKIAIADVHAAFISAFSDYVVPINMPLSRFSTMLMQNGYSPSLSVGAFEDDKLIGFIFNGVQVRGGTAEAYDSGTGVAPEWRHKGITTILFERASALLREYGAKRYWLEVIKSNTPAVSLYKKQGFETKREFFCFESRKDAVNRRLALDGITIEDVPICSDTDGTFEILGELQNVEPQEYIKSSDTLNSPVLSPIWDFIPSWQNSTESVKAVASSHAAVKAFVDGTFAAYGVIDKSNGRIPQLAVVPSFRRRGVGARVLSALLNRTESETVSCVNVDANSYSSRAFWEAMGFKIFIEQYEMFLML